MTLIMAMKTDAGILIGSDSAFSTTQRVWASETSKVQNINGTWIGVGGVQALMVSLQRHSVNAPVFDGSDYLASPYMFVVDLLIPWMRQSWAIDGLLRVDNAVAEVEGELVVVVGNDLFEIGEDGSVEEMSKMAMCGSGHVLAWPAWEALKMAGVKRAPRKLMEIIFESVVKHHPYVRGPFVYTEVAYE